MPEYLAPGVYVEEVDTGAKPIEGVSTSTAGMVGVTERGPVDVPVLITSVGDFTRWYGGQLRNTDYNGHCFFPHAIEGFFANGGKRVYVTRVLDAAATKASSPQFDRGSATSISATLIRPVSEGTGSAVNPPSLVLLPTAGLAAGDWVRIGDGSTAEYRQASGAPIPQTVMATLDLPLSFSHANTETISNLANVPLAGTYATADDIEPGSAAIVVQGTHADIALLAAADMLEIGATAVAEYRTVVSTSQVAVVSATDSTIHLTLDSALLLSYATGAAVVRLDLAPANVSNTVNIETAVAGGSAVFLASNVNFTTQGDYVLIDGGAHREVRHVGDFSQFDVAPGAFDDYALGTLIQAVTFPAARTLTGTTATTATLQAGETAGLVVGQRIVVSPAGTPETVTIQSIDDSTDTLTITPAFGAAHAAGDAVVPLAKAVTANVAAGSRVLALDDRMGLVEGSILRIGTGPNADVVTVTGLPSLSFMAPDPGNVIVFPGVSAAHASGSQVSIVGDATPVAARQACVLALPAVQGATELYVSDGTSFVAADAIRLTTPGGEVYFHVLTQNAAAVAAEMLTLTTNVARAHPVGSAVVGRAPLFDVEALDAGQWGNRLRISVEDETPGLVSNTTLSVIVNPTHIRLASASGVQPGTILELFDTATGAVIGDPVKVTNVNRTANFTLTLAGVGLSAPQQAVGLGVRSREFRVTVLLLRQPDPSTPTRNEQVLDSEVFRYLSMDPRHSNYVEKVIGDIDGLPLRKWDRRPEGSSLYIRVRDRAANQAEEESVRLGPETLYDILPDGRRVPARLRLELVVGDDSTTTISDNTYIGLDNADPDLRSGLQALRNIEEVSIVAIPGRFSPSIQQAVIDHCELMRYRFAVLDSRAEPTDTISDVQDQRQQFDTKYAALYYPWLSITDPYPTNLANVQEYAIPPSGHVIGVYARTDIERGVHKAPANEVVRGIVGLRRKVNKEQQDILNPFPVNINVIRDFRDNNRGIRIYGGRVITSDPDWKYVNVRRLTIFIENSLDRGLQWVVFEPNAEPLWARVRRAITNFLTVVWRNGALEGTKVEEAFFVKCDRTTMTQTDIDNGRLIVLVGIAPVKPAEFVIVRIGLWTARSDS